MAETFKYQGNELELFRNAINWKKYFARQIKPFIHGNVLEVGAGIGATTLLLNDGKANSWTMLEPDEAMFADITKKKENGEFLTNTKLAKGTIGTLGTAEKYDTIIYIDVLEHIEADAAEMAAAASLLTAGGRIIVLSPAFQSLYSPFDKAIGHFRRYTKSTLKKAAPPALETVSIRYYDSAGYFASLVNKIFLRQSYPTQKQVLFWDRWIVPVSRVTDVLCFHSFGKSIIGIWQNKH